MALLFEGNQVQTDGDVNAMLERLRKDPRTENPRVLVVLQERQMQARNGGYPVFMHHDTLSPQRVENERQEEALAQQGFRREYKHKSYPTWLHRRNMHPRFAKSQEEQIRMRALSPEAQKLEMAVVNEGDFIESVQVKDEAHEAKLMAQQPNALAGIGKWCHDVTEIDPISQGPEEDPLVTIARLQGQLAGLQGTEPESGEDQRPRRGRPPKQVVAA